MGSTTACLGPRMGAGSLGRSASLRPRSRFLHVGPLAANDAGRHPNPGKVRPMRSRLGSLSILLLTIAASAGPADGLTLEPQEQPTEETGQGSWIRVLNPDAPPPSYERITTVYDAAHDRLLLLRDGWELWALSLGTAGRWQRLPAGGEPPEIFQFHSVVHDPKGDRLLVFGGITTSGQRSNGVWELRLADGPHWSRLMPAGPAPAPRSHHGAIYDAANDRMIVVGGNGTSEVWALEFAETSQWRA